MILYHQELLCYPLPSRTAILSLTIKNCYVIPLPSRTAMLSLTIKNCYVIPLSSRTAMAYGCIIVYKLLQGDGWCVPNIPSHEADPSTHVTIRGLPSTACEATPLLTMHYTLQHDTL
nr:hypothetical protein [Tanacetum cinerariifolium]